MKTSDEILEYVQQKILNAFSKTSEEMKNLHIGLQIGKLMAFEEIERFIKGKIDE